ncbi:MAG: hypothetical protein UU40_C0001G0051 [Candidatus Uhrbacteria bacterium GW2011_GWD2_41_121]|uniref:Uncharacterized protein n=1 Tax=Candidatus Uhrbacteria bacterium GW2011_GWC1_41_20 TaxID=1618983 RepID=A0A0G0VK21_9BACT|nr:MAG: hypothetical protein UT52_C0001G0019 [Candidatus Uhrbacteria bacterium GW2011_GWE1_39_46]KKR64408.1 MAG: hypothetical protein UU04_C0002G0019 [Candidatus Uhrbacteria bacterium GW2011_GWC2_40_450]KKR89636.1 MAG: hypothetical protein UU36_C0021G0007 [Candidatus Uhrbacteria bacterium GW2011_GWE2_41_1153]KKR90713.1 MAG: hypothetical protein UU40_C0001G0051 [Candidatus Uhrbacteria bacterium GW2011_GWD2_41_121]KKR96570.1 MAG: hypothetical protein UU46_C0001G0019 [Candidatus Uhrbacteria bacter
MSSWSCPPVQLLIVGDVAPENGWCHENDQQYDAEGSVEYCSHQATRTFVGHEAAEGECSTHDDLDDPAFEEVGNSFDHFFLPFLWSFDRL